jgi:hypothetical protein
MASIFARWYIAKLKAFPMITNVSSGVILMSTGDVLAQHLETIERSERCPTKQIQDHATTSHTARGTFDLGSDVFGCLGMAAVEEQVDEVTSRGSVNAPHALSTSVVPSLSSPPSMDDLDSALRSMQDRLAFWKPSRTATMAAWCFFYTPFYVAVYKMYDKYLPRKTPGSIAARVGMSFAFSIPINAAFYLYGTTINHTIDWYSELRQSRVPYRFDVLMEKTRLKIENELVRTVMTSGTMWVPINLVTFSVVPSHLQPLSLMFFSMFWNCYLSMSQYRAVQGGTLQSSMP